MSSGGSGALYGFAYTKKALDYLGNVPTKMRHQIVAKIKALASEPRPNGCRMVKGMRDGDDPVHRIRSGDYRVLYRPATPSVFSVPAELKGMGHWLLGHGGSYVRKEGYSFFYVC